MRKQIFLLSLLSLSLFSCANKSNDSIVNEQEMYDALTLKGVECIQTILYRWNNPTVPLTKNEISPNRYHFLYEEGTDYNEYYLFQEGDTIETIKEWRSTEKGVPVEEVPYTGDQFCTIEFIKEQLLGPFVDKKYEDFEYQKDTKEYIVRFDDEILGKCVSAIKFSKKKVTEFTTWQESSDREHFNTKIEFGYEEIIPIPPLS